MKLQFHPIERNRGERGSAVVVVLVLLLVIMAFLEANTSTLRSLKKELQLIEQRQMIKYGELALTNSIGTVSRGPNRMLHYPGNLTGQRP